MAPWLRSPSGPDLRGNGTAASPPCDSVPREDGRRTVASSPSAVFLRRAAARVCCFDLPEPSSSSSAATRRTPVSLRLRAPSLSLPLALENPAVERHGSHQCPRRPLSVTDEYSVRFFSSSEKSCATSIQKGPKPISFTNRARSPVARVLRARLQITGSILRGSICFPFFFFSPRELDPTRHRL